MRRGAVCWVACGGGVIREKALQEAFRVLKRGGRFMCLEFSHVSLPGVQQAYDLYSFEVIPR